MTVTPVPDLTVPQNVGFADTDTAPIIHSIRWRHLPSRYIFNDVGDVITYHQKGPLIIDIKQHTVSYLDVYFLRSAGIVSARAYLRFVKNTDGTLIEEPYTVGESGNTIVLADDTVNPDLLVMKGIAFTQTDLGDGTPMYDFMSMSDEGIYEVWVKAVTSDNKELHVRIPFQWANLVPSTPDGTGGTPPPSGVEDHSPKLEHYDEYYVTIVEGDSAFTKRPSTHFRMAGIGMLQAPYCYERINTPPQAPIMKPVDVPIIGDTPAPPCALELSPISLQGDVGSTVKFTLVHKNTSGVLKVVTQVDDTAISDLGDGEVEILKSGTFPVTFIVTYNDGQECKISGTVTGVTPPPQPEPPTPVPTPSPFTCDLSVTGDLTAEVGQTITLQLDQGANSGGVVDVSYPQEVTKTGDYTFTSPTIGAYTIEFTVTYPEGICKKTVVIEFTAPTQQPSPTSPGTLMCGHTADGDTGYAERTVNATESGVYYIEYNFFAAEDRMYVYAGNKLIYDTGLKTYSSGSPFGFHYSPADGVLKIVMNDGKGTGTRWNYTIYCPSNVPNDIKTVAPIVN